MYVLLIGGGESRPTRARIHLGFLYYQVDLEL